MSRSRRGLQVLLAALGVVAVVAGLVGVFTGPSLVRDAGAVLAIEFAIPVVVLPWQAAVARRTSGVSARE